MKTFIALIFCLAHFGGQAQLTDTIKVYFLYGSKPKPSTRDVEPTWFGGILGGHVGIASEKDEIVHFLPFGQFHIVGKTNNHKSTFSESSESTFWGVLGGANNEVQKLVISIPVTREQRQHLDSIHQSYLTHTPYDYAFLGMRCGSASYDILSQIGIVRRRNKVGLMFGIFYPRKLRHKLLRKAKRFHWKCQTETGITTRKWEKDIWAKPT